MLDVTSIKNVLADHAQEQVLRFWDNLDETEQGEFLAQLSSINFENVDRLKAMLTEAATDKDIAKSDVAPAAVFDLHGDEKAAAVAAGAAALSAGKVGVLLVAGGQGSRLGFNGPKGSYLIGPVSNCSLFEIHSRKVLALEEKYGADVPLYIMTSEVNDEATRAFFEENSFFGLKKENVVLFKQGMWPALTREGKLILDSPGHIFMSPDGHGGILSAMKDRAVLADMEKRGLETLFYFQVDNPMVEIADPAFIGLHRQEQADISVKVCAKRDPGEGIGVVVVRGGRQAVVEYTEMTEEQNNARLPDGELKFKYGSVAIHIFDFKFLLREAEAGLPIHLAHKKVPFCDDDGNTVKPTEPNAYKFEKFIFDVIPDAKKAVNVVFAREDEFSPVKNAEGNDSPATTKRDMVRKCARWLEAAGVDVPQGENGEPAFLIEIDPCYALNPEDLGEKLPAGFKLDADTFLK